MTLDQFVQRRTELLKTMDVLGYVQLMLEVRDEFVTPNVALIQMHKARYEVFNMPPELKEESRRWLEERGHARQYMLPWPARTPAPHKA